MANLFIRRFNDDIYTLRVGSTQHRFIVHKDILNLSRVLSCMTNGSFSESVKKEIVLPEDDADSVGRILEHLYGNNDAAFDINLLDFEGAEKLADMYGLADKYQLPDFQERVIRKLKQLDVLREDRMAFFHIARKIWENTRESDDIFGSYFAEQAAVHLKSMSEEEIAELSNMIHSGKSFAMKTFQVQADIFSEMRRDWLKENETLKKKVASVQDQLRYATSTVEVDLAKAKRMHRSQHPACSYCHVLL